MGVKVTVGGAKGITVQVSRSLPLLKSSGLPPQCGLQRAAASSAARVYLRCLKPWDPSGPRGMSTPQTTSIQVSRLVLCTH